MPISSSDPAALVPVMDALPGPWGLLTVFLYCTFVLHLLLVNAVVGVSAITLADRLRAAPDSLRRADMRSQSILLPKGVALLVNFAIPPFLFLQGLYGPFIYSSSVLCAVWWLSLMAVVMLAYYGLYINMAQGGISGGARTAALAFSLVLLLWAAFLLVNNSTLLQSPERWAVYGKNAHGLFLNTGDPQLIPRYLHVLLSCLAVGGLCLSLPAHFRKSRLGGDAPASEREYLRDRTTSGLSCFFYATLAQLPVGGWFFLSLPPEQRRLFMGGDALATSLFFASLFLIGFALLAARRGRLLATALPALATVFLMAGMRSILRSALLEPYHQPSMRETEFGPLLLFLGALAVSCLALARLVAAYRSRAMLPMLEEAQPRADGQEPCAIPAAPRRGRPETPDQGREDDAVLVNEIAMGRMDADDQDETGPEPDARSAGGKRP